jgi:hypothetical protein
MNKKIFVLLVILFASMNVSAEWVDQWVHKNVSSQRDLFFIDLPSAIHRMEPVTVTVYVNDPVVLAEANLVEPNPDNSNFYTTGKKVYRDSSGDLRTFIPYNGESSFTVGFKTNSFWINEVKNSQPDRLYFAFYKMKKPPEGTDPSTSDPNSEYYNWECARYYTPYFCSSKEGCEVCVKQLAIVWKDYELLPSRAAGNPPAGYKWVDNRGTDEDLLTNPGYLSYSYSDENKPVPGQFYSDGTPITCPDSFGIKIDSMTQMDTDFASLKADYERYNKAGIASGKTTVSETSGPGGLFSGKAVEILTKDSGGSQWDGFSVSLEIFAGVSPENSGLAHITMSRSGCTSKGGAKGEIDKALSDLKTFAASYSVQYTGSQTPGFKPKHYYDMLRRETGNSITGRITDGHNNPMPYLGVSIEYEGRSYDGRTDDGGNYDIKVPTLDFDEKNPKIGTLRLYLSYIRDGKNYFNVLDRLAANKLVYVEKNFSLETEMDKTQDFDYGTTSFTDTSSSSNPVILKHAGPIYFHLSEITDFALTQLKADIDYLLPVDVIFASASGTAYSRDTSTININIDDSVYGSSDRPDNREYHEFCHHILFSQWNGSGLRGPGDANHDGYINTGTGDSYTEGFAEFCAMACSKYKGEPKPDIYAGFGSLELNYKAWGHRGYDEELAVAGILWDLYDDKNDKGDTVSIPIGEMWGILKVRRPNFYEYYKAFKAAYPEKSDAIDKIFIEHGFFADKDKGNGAWDAFEPFRDADGDGAYTAGEQYVDYGVWNDTNMSYDPGETIGKATNYDRENRSSIVKLRDSYVKASDPAVTKYKVKVHFPDATQGEDYEYSVDVKDGLVYVAPIPEDLGAEITVEPDTIAYSSDKPYKTTNKEYVTKYYAAKVGSGFVDVHDFEIKPTGLKEEVSVLDEKTLSVSGGTKTTTKPGKETGTLQPDQGTESGMNNTSLLLGGAGILLILTGLGLFVILAVAVLVMKKKGKK